MNSRCQPNLRHVLKVRNGGFPSLVSCPPTKPPAPMKAGGGRGGSEWRGLDLTTYRETGVWPQQGPHGGCMRVTTALLGCLSGAPPAGVVPTRVLFANHVSSVVDPFYFLEFNFYFFIKITGCSSYHKVILGSLDVS